VPLPPNHGMEGRKACHNCRRNRRRCDRSIPSCNKCHSLGQDCLGYGQLFRWTDSVASRGHLKGKTTFAKKHAPGPSTDRQLCIAKPGAQAFLHALPRKSLVDPVFQDLDLTSKFYLNYYSSRLSVELVAHDYVGINPFKDLVPMSSRYTFLRPIIIAVSALHYSNLIRRAAPGDKHESAASVNALVHALDARHNAVKALQRLLEGWQQEKAQGALQVSQRSGPEIDAFLATVVFFINFALIDSGGGGWQAHLGAAGRLLIPQAVVTAGDDDSQSLICQPRPMSGFDSCLATLFPDLGPDALSATPSPVLTSPRQLTVRDYVASDAVAYHVWNRTLESLIASGPVLEGNEIETTQAQGSSWELDPDSLLPIMLRTESNCYHSCPAILLHLMLRTSRLVRQCRISESPPAQKPAAMDYMSEDTRLSMFMDLLHEAQSFDVELWAAEMSARNAADLGANLSPELETALRTHIGAVYRATACLYILLAAPGLYRYVEHQRDSSDLYGEHQQYRQRRIPTLPTTSELADLILYKLSMFEPNSPFFKYTTWPVFMTGVEAGPTGDRRAWVMARLERMYDMCPWGMLKSAMDVLGQIWAARDEMAVVKLEKTEASPDGLDRCGESENRESSISTTVEQAGMVDDHDFDWLSKLHRLNIDCLIV